jgi:hypothetical protein
VSDCVLAADEGSREVRRERKALRADYFWHG